MLKTVQRLAGGVAISASLVFLAGCGLFSPRYYAFAEHEGTLGCFDSVPGYYREFAVIERPDGVSNDELIDMALKRANALFAGERGIYRHLFHDQFITDPRKCTKDRTLAGARQVAISPFTTGAAAPASTNANNGSKDAKENGKSGEAAEARAQTLAITVALDDNTSRQSRRGSKRPANASQARNDKDGTKDDKTKNGKNKSRDEIALSIPADVVQRTTLVLSSYLYSNRPADRLEKVYALITPIDPGVEFLSVDEPVIKQPLIDFGKLTQSGSLDFSAIPFGTARAQLLSATPKLSASIERQIKRQFATQNVEILPLRNVLLLSEDGGPAEADLSGNKSVTLTLRLPATGGMCRFHAVYDLSADGKAFERGETCHIDRIPALMTAVAVVRAVGLGDRTVDEGDDSVTWIPFKSSQIFDLWTNPKSLYGINVGSSAVMVGNDKRERLLFSSFSAALRFRGWLAAQGADAMKQLHAGKLASAALGGVSLGLDSATAATNVDVCLYRKPDRRLADIIPARPEAAFCKMGS